MKTIERIKQTGEVFTPIMLVNTILDQLLVDNKNIFSPNTTYIDPACGHGNFLIEVCKRKNTIHYVYGVDLMIDNVCDTIARLQLYNLTKQDVFDEQGTSKLLKDYEGHHIDYSFDYLKQIGKFDRTYCYIDYMVYVSFKDILYGPNGSEAGVFEYKITKRTKTIIPWTVCNTIVCADGVTFAYNFEDI